MPSRWCNRCRQLVPLALWATHYRSHDNRPQWSPNRDQARHAAFARQVKRRDGNRCVECGATENLRAAHIVPIAEGGSYVPENGRTLCAGCDRASDPHAR